jgi:ferric-dicitrate binding protein FerR (iron transport regulator)
MVHRFPEIEMQYAVSEQQAWKSIVTRMEKGEHSVRSITLFPYFRMAIAASLLLMLGLSGFMRYYTKTVYAPAGNRYSFYMPDSSFIEMNAQSTLKFHPYWFSLSRTVTLDGEAYFKITKGNRFDVKSKLGETTVLGTTLNIFARDTEYSVTCFTGKVRVVSAGKKERVLLNPNEQAFLNKDGFLRFVQDVNPETVKSWRDNMFVFTGSSIAGVLQEIERQYNIKISFQANPGLTYTGNFSRSLSGKEVLDLVCTSLGIKFEAKSDNEFLVK